ncbi:transposase domain-containing protein [Thalassobius sp. I31.1]|uniref:transposase domain-containing protein n=1 Tax=Thalassobius sp. I31.1 TaxID=2109912 RepID=UPI0013003F23|nr:transposase domain-containing protein [Thalassobius sp. I31.1]
MGTSYLSGWDLQVEPYAYLKATLETIAAGRTASKIEELMSWNFDKSPDDASRLPCGSSVSNMMLAEG